MTDLASLLLEPPTHVSRRIAPGETMDAEEPEFYFRCGASALACCVHALLLAGRPAPRRILDFACGHGRVLRHLAAAFPAAELVAVDLRADGVAFCREEFGAEGVVGDADPARTPLRGPFDLVWCGSLLTHLDVDGWVAVLERFASVLAPDGVIVTTTHGRWAAYRVEQGNHYGLATADVPALLAAYRDGGFGYRDYPGTPGYGISLSSPAWILRELRRWPRLRVVAFSEAAWHDHQDVLALTPVP